MSLIIAIVTDVIAIVALAYVLYFRRHRRRDLLLSYVALNVGVLAVTVALSSVEVGIGLGIGLFGILSIIRLRSDQIAQQEIAYYFVALALGLLAGLQPSPIWLTPLLSGLMLLVMAVIDSPLLAARTQRRTLTLDRAYLDEQQLRSALAELLHADILHAEASEIDLVRETTIVDVRYRMPRAGRGPLANTTVSEPTATRPVDDPHAGRMPVGSDKSLPAPSYPPASNPTATHPTVLT